jgi:hypothetical protein
MAPVVSVCANAVAEYKKNVENNAMTDQNGRRAVNEVITIVRSSSC